MYSINENWARRVGFAEFCKPSSIAKLSPEEQIKLYESTSGKKVKKKKIKRED